MRDLGGEEYFIYLILESERSKSKRFWTFTDIILEKYHYLQELPKRVCVLC
jgi:hypothetical protein